MWIKKFQKEWNNKLSKTKKKRKSQGIKSTMSLLILICFVHRSWIFHVSKAKVHFHSHCLKLLKPLLFKAYYGHFCSRFTMATFVQGLLWSFLSRLTMAIFVQGWLWSFLFKAYLQWSFFIVRDFPRNARNAGALLQPQTWRTR